MAHSQGGSGCGWLVLLAVAALFASEFNPDTFWAWFVGLGLGGIALVAIILRRATPPPGGEGGQPILSGGAGAAGAFIEGDGASFERYVAEELRRRGFLVAATPDGADFGADIIASTAGHRIAVQVKNYATPVGVSAVQEVHAARDYYGTQEAWVVSRSGFTAPAAALAQRTQVGLLGLKELPFASQYGWRR